MTDRSALTFLGMGWAAQCLRKSTVFRVGLRATCFHRFSKERICYFLACSAVSLSELFGLENFCKKC